MNILSSHISEIAETITEVHSSGQNTLQPPTESQSLRLGASRSLPVPWTSDAAKVAEIIAQRRWDELLEFGSIAPWAEVVPGAPYPMTVDDLARWPDDGYRYELVRGRLVRMPPPGGGHGIIAANLCGELRAYVRRHRLGYVFAAETGFRLDKPGDSAQEVKAADASFVQLARAPDQNSPEWATNWQLPPDLVAEIASPSQNHSGMDPKAREWLEAGVRLVWVIWPQTKQVDVWLPGNQNPGNTLRIGDALDGLDVVPGFSYPLQDLFEM
jgi:Uma2 family endonuclease